MQPSEEMLDDIRRERLARARRMSPEEKLVSGPRLFAVAVECMRAGIRLQYPEADQRRVQELVSQRIARLREAVTGRGRDFGTSCGLIRPRTNGNSRCSGPRRAGGDLPDLNRG
jgi:hypothetical protein